MKTALQTTLACCLISAVACAAVASHAKFEDFKVKLTGVAVMSANADDDKGVKALPPQTRIVVPPGNLAVFYLEYNFPTNVKSRLYLAPNFDDGVLDENPFGTSPSGLVSGNGKITKIVLLGAGGNEPYEKDLLLKSVRISGELEAKKGAPRNNSFFICDAPVDVLFANNAESDGKDAVVLPPKPSPAPDPKLGVVPFGKKVKPKSSTPAGFTDNLDEALAKAKKEGKLVYACFSGSDWCGWCKKLEREVFAQQEFVPAVEKDYVLVFIDSPRNKGVLTARAKNENPKLVKKYGIKGFPTALIFDGDGKKVGETTGYRKGGAKAYAEHLLEIKRMEIKQKRENAYTRYRFAVDAASGSGNCMQLSDIALYDESGAAIPSSTFELSFDDGLHGLKGVSAISPDEEGPENAVDGDHDTKWLDWRGGRDATKEQRSAVYLEFRFAAPTKLSGYAWFTANDSPDRSPSAWRFLASNDGASWTELDAVKGFRGSDKFKSMAFRRRFADIPLYRFKVDATKFPEVAKLVEEKFIHPIEAMAPNVVSLLDGAGAKWTGGEITIVPTDEEGCAWTSAGDDKIWLCNDFVRESPDEVVGACLHEFGHLVQDYRSLKGRADPYDSGPDWLCEGIVDWVRWFNMEGEAGVKRATEDAKKNPKLDEGYGITASFLDYIARTCDRDFVAKLNKTCRDGRYGEGVWKDLTGNTLAELEEEWKRSLKGLKRRSSKIVSSADAKDILDWADPFIGSAGTGHTTPAAAYPFGMVQPGPDTGLGGWERCSSYQYGDSRIERFSQTHLSGTGCSDFSDVAFMPFTGDVKAAHTAKFRYGFDKSTEKASPGYYAVELKSGVKVEATCTEHVALYRFTFRDAAARLLYDPTWGHGRVAAATISPMEGRRVSGHVSDRRGWPDRDYYFAWEVSAEPTSASVVERDKRSDLPKTVYSFENLGNGGVLYLKVSLSRSSAEGARRNIDAEVPGWDFDGVLAANRAKWRSIFSRVEAKGAVEQLKTLYTSIYHLCFQPNRLSDVGEKPIYSTFSCWDTYRAAGPLYTILMPEYVPAFIDSMLWHFDQNGYLPVWTLWGRDNQCMVGVHSVPMIVDACLKGLGNGEPITVDWERAWRDVKATLTENRGRGIARYELIEKYGYYPCDVINDESVSRLLEDCYDQYCAYRLVDALGKTDEARFFRDRSLNWTNLFDSATGFMRAKDTKGAWRTPFDPYRVHGRVHHNYTEGNAFHWNWHVMQDPELLVGMLGGRDAALKRLTALFEEDASKLSEAPPDVTGLIGQYCHGNEPSHHVIYFFSILGRRDLAAKYIREVMDTQYGVEPDGLCGNDDCGQMSAWCIFASLGFYPFNPCGGEYVLGEAQLPSVSIDVGGGKTLCVESEAPGEASRAVELNGRKLEGVKISHADVMKGGTLRFVGGESRGR